MCDSMKCNSRKYKGGYYLRAWKIPCYKTTCPCLAYASLRGIVGTQKQRQPKRRQQPEKRLIRGPVIRGPVTFNRGPVIRGPVTFKRGPVIRGPVTFKRGPVTFRITPKVSATVDMCVKVPKRESFGTYLKKVLTGAFTADNILSFKFDETDVVKTEINDLERTELNDLERIDVAGVETDVVKTEVNDLERTELNDLEGIDVAGVELDTKVGEIYETDGLTMTEDDKIALYNL